jgi:hypothetical protein
LGFADLLFYDFEFLPDFGIRSGSVPCFFPHRF